MYDKTIFKKTYRYYFSWYDSTFCNVYLQIPNLQINPRIDSVCMITSYSNFNVVYWNPDSHYEMNRILISKPNVSSYENQLFLHKWIETYITSDEGMYDIIVNRFLYRYMQHIPIQIKNTLLQIFTIPENRDDDYV